MKKMTKIIDIRVDDGWLYVVQAAADKKNMSLSSFIMLAVREYIERHR